MTTPDDWADAHATPVLHPNVGQEMAVRTPAAGTRHQDYDPVRVAVVASPPVPDRQQQGSYRTMVIPASAGAGASWVQLLPADPLRVHAYIAAIDEPIVISTSEEAAQSANNVGAAAGPSGAYIGTTGWAPPVRHQEAVYAANTSASVSTRVSIISERKA